MLTNFDLRMYQVRTQDVETYLNSLPNNQLILLYYTIAIPNEEYLLYQNYYQLAVRVQSQSHVFDTIDRKPFAYTHDIQIYAVGNGGFANDFLVNTVSETQTHSAGKNIILSLPSRLIGTEVRMASGDTTYVLGKLQTKVYGLNITPTSVGVVQATMRFGTLYGGAQAAEYPSNFFEYAAKYV